MMGNRVRHLFYSNIEPNLWIQALSYFASKEENCKTQIAEVLTRILLKIFV